MKMHFEWLLLASLAACAGDEPPTDDEPCLTCEAPPPFAKQVLVTNAQPDDAISGLTIAYGKHPDFLGGVEAAGVRATAVPRAAARFRVVVNELLDGKTIEEFRCAGIGWTRNPEDCSRCGDDPATADDETGRCVDVNNDRIPDVAALIPGLATIRCPGVFTYTAGRDDGYYHPSGNQLVPPAWGLDGIGPAIVFEPQVTLPASAACTFDVNAGVKDKDGNPLYWRRGSVVFHTAAE